MNAIPSFLQLVPVDIATVVAAAEGGGGPAPKVERVAGFSMTSQQEDFWCWAAVAQAVERWRGSQVSQSEVASEHIDPGGGLVCATPLNGGEGGSCGVCDGSAGCGDEHFLSQVLAGRGRLGPNGATNHVPSFDTIVEAVDDERPLPVRIHWSDNKGHFICVTGYRTTSDGTPRVFVHDPLSAGVNGGPADEVDMLYDDFSSDYDATSGTDGVPNYSYEVIP